MSSVKGLKLPIAHTPTADNIYWVYGIVLDETVDVDNKEIQKRLVDEGIGSRTFFWCMHEQPVYINSGMFQDEHYPNAEYLARKGFYIPSGLALTEEQMITVVEKVKFIMDKII